MFADMVEWNNLKGSGLDELLLELVSEDNKTQRIAAEALDYRLLAIGADRDENYGDPKVLLKDDSHVNVTSILNKIVTTDSVNPLSKNLALNLLYDIYNFANQEEVKEHYRQKAEEILAAIKSNIMLYQNLLTHGDGKTQQYAQELLALLKRG